MYSTIVRPELPATTMASPNMAVGGERTSIVIITDSRGAGLQSLIDQQMQLYQTFQVRVLVYKGTGIVEAVERAKSKLAWWQPRIVFVLNGICDVTVRDRVTKLVTPRYDSEDLMINLYKDYMTTTAHQLQPYLGKCPGESYLWPSDRYRPDKI